MLQSGWQQSKKKRNTCLLKENLDNCHLSRAKRLGANAGMGSTYNANNKTNTKAGTSSQTWEYNNQTITGLTHSKQEQDNYKQCLFITLVFFSPLYFNSLY